MQSDSPLEDLTPETYPSPSRSEQDMQMMNLDEGSCSASAALACFHLPAIDNWIETLKVFFIKKNCIFMEEGVKF